MYPEDYRRTRVWRVFSLLLAFTGGAIFYEVGMLYGLIHPVAEPLSAVQLLDRSRTAVGSLASQRELLVDLAIPGAAVAPSNPVMPKAPLNYSHDSNVIKDAAAPDIQKAAQSTDELCPITCTISACKIDFRRSRQKKECHITLSTSQTVKHDCTDQLDKGSLIIGRIMPNCQFAETLAVSAEDFKVDYSGMRIPLETYINSLPPSAVIAVMRMNMDITKSSAVRMAMLAMGMPTKHFTETDAAAFVAMKGYRVQERAFLDLKDDTKDISYQRLFNLGIRYNLTKEDISLDIIEPRLSYVEKGGHYKPTNCKPRANVAIIYPYRDREAQLRVALANMIPYLKAQNLEFTIYVVEQDQPEIFNRAALMNIGYAEAAKLQEHDTYVFHDVDMLPEDMCNLYMCAQQPRHLSATRDKNYYRMIYNTYVGGVLCMSDKQMKRINGFSNIFFGWGGEDDDIYKRLSTSGYKITRYPNEIGRYTMLTHTRDKGNPASARSMKVAMGHYIYMKKDGLNSMDYTLNRIEVLPLYTRIFVKLPGPETQKDITNYYNKKVAKYKQ